MSEITTQENRMIAIEVPAPNEGKVYLMSMHGTEALGRLFQFELDLMTETKPIKPEDILGQNVTVRLDQFNNETRFFNGYISRFSVVAVDRPRDGTTRFHYRATMVPWLWFLSRNADCRIYQEKSVLEIVKDVFERRGFKGAFDDQTQGTYRTWEYCVQYRETDFGFVSRLLENEGIYYYFKHENGKHTLVLCDAPSAHAATTTDGELYYDEPDEKKEDDNFIWDWAMGHEITPNQYCITDYNHCKPQTKLEKQMNVEHSHDPDAYEIFDFPGGYCSPDEGKEYVKVRLQEVVANYEIAHAASSSRRIFAGSIFKLIDHPAYDEPEFLITSVNYQMTSDGYGAMGGGGGGASYHCQLRCIPKDREFRSARSTPKPTIQGPQTAKVVGPSGEELHTDKYGRVKVHFYWDRWGTEDEKASCWIRVSQPWAGKTWGAISIPRIGQEVIVEFMEGDPDRPIITGRVYNGENMPPYELPGNATKTTFKTNSSKGGQGFNELRYEDKKGDEQIFMHAEKNMDLRVKNDYFETIGHNKHVTVDSNSLLHVKANYHVNIGASYYEKVGGDKHETIKGCENQDVTGDRSINLAANLYEAIGADHWATVGGKYSLNVTGDLVIESLASITLKVGGTTVSMDSSGIKIDTSGTIEQSSGGLFKALSKAMMQWQAQSMEAQAQAALEMAGATAKVTGKGALDLIAGGMIKAAGSMIKLN